MAPSLIEAVSASGAGTISLAFTQTPAAGDVVVVLVRHLDGSNEINPFSVIAPGAWSYVDGSDYGLGWEHQWDALIVEADGTGATITMDLYEPKQWLAWGYALRGVSPGVDWAVGGSSAPVVAGAGQVVVTAAASGAPDAEWAFGDTIAPAAGWVLGDPVGWPDAPGLLGGQASARVPGETVARHEVSSSGSSSFSVAVGPAVRSADLVVSVSYSAETGQTGATDTKNRVGGRSRTGSGDAVWEPPVVPAPAPAGSARSVVSAQAFGAVTMHGAQPIMDVHEAQAPGSRQRVIVGGRDVTFFRGVHTVVDYELVEPLLYGPASFSLPQVAAPFEQFGVGALKWLRPEAKVLVQRVVDDVVVETVYKGVVIAIDTTGANPTVEVGGEATGRAALREQPVPIFTFTRDIGDLMWREITDLGLRFLPRLGPTTGIKTQPDGGGSELDYIRDLCAKAWTLSGAQWTVMPDAKGVYRMRRKDRDTIHATAFPDDARVVASLRRDLAEEPNRIYGTGVTPKGQRVRFGAYPGLKQAQAAPYPMSDDSSFGIGTTNADTDTGDGISVLVIRLASTGYLSREDMPGGYDQAVGDAVSALREDAGLVDSFRVNPAVWSALFDLDVTGFSLGWSRVLPMVQRPYTRRFRRSASGAMIGKNPNYQRSRLLVDRAVDFGTGFTRPQMKAWGRAEIQRVDNWVGTLTVSTGGLWSGQVSPGETPGPERVLDATLVKPGMNISLPTFQGGITVHVSGASVDGDSVTFAVDTQTRDALEVWEVIERNRETRSTAARIKGGQRASTQVKDTVGVWDEVGGAIDGDVSLTEGWNVIPVVSGQEGSVSRLRVRLTDPVEFAVAVFGHRIGRRRLAGLIGNPLTEAGTKSWERPRITRQLEQHGIVYSAGTNEEPCGYSPGSKGDDDPLRGIHTDDAGFSYRTMPGAPVLWVAVWVPKATKLRAGWIMRQQLEAGA